MKDITSTHMKDDDSSTRGSFVLTAQLTLKPWKSCQKLPKRYKN